MNTEGQLKRNITMVISPIENSDELSSDSNLYDLFKEEEVELKGKIHRIYKENIFKIQLKNLLKREYKKDFDIVIKDNEKDEEYEYEVKGVMVPHWERDSFNNKLNNQRLTRKKEIFYKNQKELHKTVDQIYNNHKELIFLGHQLMKNKLDTNCKIMIKDDKPVLYYPFEYGYYERRDIDKIIKKINVNEHLYEILQEDLPLKPFFDLEMEGEYTKQEKEENLDLFIHFIIKEIKDLYTFQIEKKDFVILDSNTDTKLSYHILINEKVYFKNMPSHKEFVKYIINRFKRAENEKDDENEEKKMVKELTWFKSEDDKRYIVDASVYTKNRQFRMYGQSKKGKTSVLQLVSNHTIKDTFVQYDERFSQKIVLDTGLLDQYFEKELEKNHKERKTIYELKKNRRKEEDIEKKTYNSDLEISFEGLTLQDKLKLTDYDIIKMEDEVERYIHVIPIQPTYQQWLLIGMAIRRAGGTKELWDKWSQLGKSYQKGECEQFDSFDNDKNKRGYSIKTLRRIALKCKPKIFYEFSLIYSKLYHLELEDIEKKIEDSDYLSQEGTKYENNIYTDKKCLLLNSCMGKGKTHAIQRIMKKDGKRVKRCLFLSTRRTFAYFIQGEFEDFYNYLDVKDNDLHELHHSDKVIISLESILKLKKGEKYDFVVTDESETLLNNFSSETLGSKTYEIYDRFEEILMNASKIVVMDAFMSNRTLSYIKSLYKNSDILYIENKKIVNKIMARAMSYKDDLTYLRIYNYLVKGEKLYITFSSNKKMMNFKDFIYNIAIRDKVLTSDFINKMVIYNKDTTKEEMEKLTDINKIWKEASIVMTTPKITVGCSYNPEGDKVNPSFDRKISFAMHTCSARDMFQSIMRVRHVNNDKGMDFAIGYNTRTHMEKTFLLMEDFNNYEDNKTEYILKELKELVENKDSIFNTSEQVEIKSMITYLDKKKSNSKLRQILYYNAMETYMSQNYYKDYYMSLLKEVGFKLEKEEDKEVQELSSGETDKEDEIEKFEKIVKNKKEFFEGLQKEGWKDSDYIKNYIKIKGITHDEKCKLERKQKNDTSTHDENMMLEKYFFEQKVRIKSLMMPELKLFNEEEEISDITKYFEEDKKKTEEPSKIIQRTEEKKLSRIFFNVWLESQRKKCINHDYYYCMTKEEILKEQTQKVLCTEKMDYIWEKILIIKELENLIGIEHNSYQKVIEKKDILKTYEYLIKNKDYIYKIFKLRDQGKKNTVNESGKELNICLQRLNKIFGDFNGNQFYGYQYKKQRAINYKLEPIIPDYNYEYILNNVKEERERIIKEKEMENEMREAVKKYNEEYHFNDSTELEAILKTKRIKILLPQKYQDNIKTDEHNDLTNIIM